MEQPTGRLAAILSQAVDASGKSRNEVAVEALIPSATLSYILAGTRPINIEQLFRLAAVLNTTPTALLDESSDTATETAGAA